MKISPPVVGPKVSTTIYRESYTIKFANRKFVYSEFIRKSDLKLISKDVEYLFERRREPVFFGIEGFSREKLIELFGKTIHKVEVNHERINEIVDKSLKTL